MSPKLPSLRKLIHPSGTTSSSPASSSSASEPNAVPSSKVNTSTSEMDTSLQGKVVVITGGSKGIGKATALAYAAAGASIVVNYSSDSAAAEEVVSKIGGSKAIAVKANAGTVEGTESLVAKTVEKFGKIDVLVMNAGVLPMKDLEHTTEQDFDSTFALNVKGPYFLCQVRSFPTSIRNSSK